MATSKWGLSRAYSLADAAGILGVSKKTLQDAVGVALVGTVRVRGEVHIPFSEVVRLSRAEPLMVKSPKKQTKRRRSVA